MVSNVTIGTVGPIDQSIAKSGSQLLHGMLVTDSHEVVP